MANQPNNQSVFCEYSEREDHQHEWDDTYHCLKTGKPITICVFCGLGTDEEYHIPKEWYD